MAWAGAELVTTAGAGCCGALAEHAGRPGRAAELREQNLAAWGAAAGAAAIITEAAGCGVAVRGYGERLPAPQLDAIAWLAGATRPPFGEVPLKVALHDPCHARHGQGLVAEPRRLLRAIPGLVLLEPDEADACCGSGGLWSLGHPELAGTLGARKAAVLAATGADLVVTANPGCLGQIARRTGGAAAARSSDPAPGGSPVVRRRAGNDESRRLNSHPMLWNPNRKKNGRRPAGRRPSLCTGSSALCARAYQNP